MKEHFELDSETLVEHLSDEEKVDLVSGHGLWRTAAIEKHGIASIVMTDGTYGVRYSTTQIEADDSDESDLAAFQALVNQQADGMFGSTRPATCFPNGNLLGCSWDVELAMRMGEALAAECLSMGVRLLLGPGINTRRTPLAGRAYEYYSEDPVINGELAAALINALQARGIGASLKHFACNNSELDRTTMSSDVDERALREIYLAGFERAIAKSNPWTVMSAYNPINGVQASEHAWLLTSVLRREWDYEGVVISDWHAIKDRVASIAAGCDLDMPESKPRKRRLLTALKAGRVDRARLDDACRRMLDLARKCSAIQLPTPVDLETHHQLARQIAAESIVLLRNRDDVLPLDPARLQRIVVIGDGAIRPQIQGSGSATTNPYRVDLPLECMRARCRASLRVDHVRSPPTTTGQDAEAAADILSDCVGADIVIVFAENVKNRSGEGNDRDSLLLEPWQDTTIATLNAAGHKVVVVLSMPDAVAMPWLNDVDAVLAAFYPGQGGGEAIAQLIFGERNPCGKLSTTMPLRIEDIPGWHSYPGENRHHVYSEGIFVGYRFYDHKKIEPLFPFGHGLTYTQFSYDALSLDRQDIGADDVCHVSFTLRNSGARQGKEIVQLYVRPIEPDLARPVRELKAFAKIDLEPGEMKVVALVLSRRDFCHYDPAEQCWVLRAKAFAIEVGASSRDIRLTGELTGRSDAKPARKPSAASTPAEVLSDPRAERALRNLLADKLGLSTQETENIIEKISGSFLGIYDTISWYLGDKLQEEDIADLLANLH
ncbi:beta-glucosidase family protein [Rhizobium sp. A22-96]